jgi:hypothetical protein
MIKPTVGRVLWFTPSVAWATENDVAYGAVGEPLAAIVAHVINDRMVNLAAFDQNGKPFNATSVPLKHGDDEDFIPEGSFYATWMPYQKGQAAKAEALENKLSGDTPTPAQCGHGFNDRAFVTRDLVMNLVCQGKHAEHIQNEVPILLELIFGVDPNKTECDRDPDISHALAALQGVQGHTVKASAPPVDTIEQEIQAKGLTAPRITPADVEANIASEHFFTAADAIDAGIVVGYKYPGSLDLLTICVLTLQNGFTVTGESACASPENFDAEIGRKIARENAVQKIWPLMGYELKQRLHEQRVIEPGRAEVVATWIDHNNNRIRHGVECDISEIQDSCIHLERYVNNWQENALKEHATGFQAITTEGT